MSRTETTLAEGTRAIQRVAHAWRVLGREQRWAALAAIGLFISMLLPWYSKTSTFVEHNAAKSSQASLSAFQAFSFVEAAVLLVSAGVLAMLFARAEDRRFQLPGGDGTIVTIAGAWAALLIFYRLLDKPTLQGTQRITATVGVEWGIFIALLLALAMLYVGRRIRTSERGQAPLSRPRDPAPAQRAAQRERTQESDAQDAETVVRPVDEKDDDLGSHPESAARDATSATMPLPAKPRPALGAEPRPASSAGRQKPRARPRFPPPPPGSPEQMSFEDSPTEEE
ncbi:MAG: hypothetical protein ACYDHT_11420 [Solirubrobacteraceae bacterium]